MRCGLEPGAREAEAGVGGLVDLAGGPRRGHSVPLVWRWVRFRGAGGPALSGFLIAAGARQQGIEVWLGVLFGLGWLVGRGARFSGRPGN